MGMVALMVIMAVMIIMTVMTVITIIMTMMLGTTNKGANTEKILDGFRSLFF